MLELINWVRSGEYDNILRGNYTNNQKKEQNGFKDFKDATNAYKEEFKKPMEGVINEVKDSVDDITKKFKDGFDSWKNRGK